MSTTNVFRSTLADKIECLSADRDARIESHNGVDSIAMDDAGDGEFFFAVSGTEAAELVRMGLCRDAR